MKLKTLKKIEDEQDIIAYEKAVKEYEKNPKSYSLEEVETILGIK